MFRRLEREVTTLNGARGIVRETRWHAIKRCAGYFAGVFWLVVAVLLFRACAPPM